MRISYLGTNDVVYHLLWKMWAYEGLLCTKEWHNRPQVTAKSDPLESPRASVGNMGLGGNKKFCGPELVVS